MNKEETNLSDVTDEELFEALLAHCEYSYLQNLELDV